MENSDTPKRGRGRPPGSHNRISQAAREAAQQSGKLPHEILLSIARGEPQEVIVLKPDGSKAKKLLAVQSLDELRSAAKDAAPYYAPRISTVEVTQGVSDDDLIEFIKRAAEEAGLGLSFGGDGTEGGRAETANEETENPPPRTRRRVLE